MISKVSLINKSTVLTSSDMTAIAMACNLQVSRDLSPAWGRLPLTVEYAPVEGAVPASAAKVYMWDYTDSPGALGYHDETMFGRVYANIFVRTIQSYGLATLFNNLDPTNITVSSVTSHEVLELIGNPYVDLWADGTELDGCSEYAYELCDAVEANTYQIIIQLPKANKTTVATKVSVSNFLYPQYFDTATPARTKIDQMGLLSTPYTMTSGGYMILRDTSGNEIEVFGAHYPEVLKVLNGFKK